MITPATAPAIAPDLEVALGGVAIASGEGALVARGIVGGVAIALWCAPWRVAALAHPYLPGAARGDDDPRRAAGAVRALVERLAAHGVPVAATVAHLIGGAHPFDATGLLCMGRRIAADAADALARHHVAVAGQHLGGRVARDVTLDAATGRVVVTALGKERAL